MAEKDTVADTVSTPLREADNATDSAPIDESPRETTERNCVCARIKPSTLKILLWLAVTTVLLLGTFLGFVDANTLELLRPTILALAQQQQEVNHTLISP